MDCNPLFLILQYRDDESSELLWREHAHLLDAIDVETNKLQEAQSLVLMHQRAIMRQRNSFHLC